MATGLDRIIEQILADAEAKAAEQVAAAEEEAKKTLADAAAEVTRTHSELSLYERPEDGTAAVEVEE